MMWLKATAPHPTPGRLDVNERQLKSEAKRSCNSILDVSEVLKRRETSMLIQGKDVRLRYPSTSLMKMVRVVNLGRYQHSGNLLDVCALFLNVLKGNPLGNAVKAEFAPCKLKQCLMKDLCAPCPSNSVEPHREWGWQLCSSRRRNAETNQWNKALKTQ